MHVQMIFSVSICEVPITPEAASLLSVQNDSLVDYGTELIYTCDSEHRFDDGFQTKFIICHGDGNWSSILSSCHSE